MLCAAGARGDDAGPGRETGHARHSDAPLRRERGESRRPPWCNRPAPAVLGAARGARAKRWSCAIARMCSCAPTSMLTSAHHLFGPFLAQDRLPPSRLPIQIVRDRPLASGRSRRNSVRNRPAISRTLRANMRLNACQLSPTLPTVGRNSAKCRPIGGETDRRRDHLPTDRPTDRRADRPLDGRTDRPSDRSTARPNHRPCHRPCDGPAARCTDRPTD